MSPDQPEDVQAPATDQTQDVQTPATDQPEDVQTPATDQDVQASATMSLSTHRLTRENLAAVDTSSSSVVPLICQAES